MSQDIKLCYFGGSGGFILLHLLLLSGKFTCEFRGREKNLDKIIDHQWNIKNPECWKAQEIGLNNAQTQKLNTNQSKIYFFCNPTIDQIKKFKGKVVFLYTDVLSQLELSYYKKAYVFFGPKKSSYFSYYRHRLKLWINHYNDIRDPQWPRCFGPNKFSRLPVHIKDELLSDPYTTDLLNIVRYNEILIDGKNKDPHYKEIKNLFLDNARELTNGSLVSDEVFNFFQHTDVSIKLQTAINDLTTLSDITGEPVNQAQVDLRNRWISLHPPELLKNIGINVY
jgi:hypothetical protein